MSDLDEVFEACRRAAATGTAIDTSTARKIAGMWHTGETSAALAFASTGKLIVSPDELWLEMFGGTLAHLDDRGRLIAAQMRHYLTLPRG